jgi:PadR family transcriptional regulator, regulatory protein PadR
MQLGVSTFEQWVLMALLRLKDEAYGRRIHDEIETCVEQDVPIAQVYVTLERLAQKGFVTSTVGEATAIRGGRAKRYFRLTSPGKTALKAALQRQDRLRAGLPGLFGVKS